MHWNNVVYLSRMYGKQIAKISRYKGKSMRKGAQLNLFSYMWTVPAHKTKWFKP
jgi:hypothetical protein